MIRRGTRLALPLLLAQLSVGCHLIYPFDVDVNAADGGPGRDLPQTGLPDLAQDLPQIKPPSDLSTSEASTDPDAAPTCAAQTLFSAKVASNAGWTMDGTGTRGPNSIIFMQNQESSIFFLPKSPVTIPVGCGTKILVSGSFSDGELHVMLYPSACFGTISCNNSVGIPTICSLEPDTSGSGYSCVAPPASTPRAYMTIRIRRPAATLVGSAKASYIIIKAI